MTDRVNLATVEKMWRREVEAATTYRHLANREKDPKRRDILVRLAEQKGCGLAELPLADMQSIEPRIDETIRSALSVEAAVASRTSFAGTAPDNVRRAAAAARERLL